MHKMNNIVEISRGYKPHVVRELLNITKERLRYWRSNLDPKQSRSHFSSSDVFAYRILHACTQDLRISPSELKKFNLKNIFHFCQNNSFNTISKYILCIDHRIGKVSIIKDDDGDTKFRNRKIQYLFLEELVREHTQAFMMLGSNNHSQSNDFKQIIPFTH